MCGSCSGLHICAVAHCVPAGSCEQCGRIGSAASSAAEVAACDAANSAAGGTIEGAASSDVCICRQQRGDGSGMSAGRAAGRI